MTTSTLDRVSLYPAEMPSWIRTRTIRDKSQMAVGQFSSVLTEEGYSAIIEAVAEVQARHLGAERVDLATGTAYFREPRTLPDDPNDPEWMDFVETATPETAKRALDCALNLALPW